MLSPDEDSIECKYDLRSGSVAGASADLNRNYQLLVPVASKKKKVKLSFNLL